jgi:hypothetical protein
MALTGNQREQFETTGVLRLDSAFSAADAALMRDVVWRYVERKMPIPVDDPALLKGRVPVSFKGLKRHRAFAPLLGNVAVRGALDDIFAPRGWQVPKPGAQILLTLPTPGEWALPHTLWHMDTGFHQPTWPVQTVKLFAFFGQVDHGGGGTVLLSGSHRLVDRFRTTLPEDGRGGNSGSWGRFMKQDAWLQELSRPGVEPARSQRFLDSEHMVDGIPLRVIELTGQPGDVVITHLHVFHCVAPNVSTRPRLMLGKGIGAMAADSGSEP